MRRQFLRISTLFFILSMSISTAWGQNLADMATGLELEDPTAWFYVNLTAKPSTPACGTNPGQVWLVHTDAKPTDILDENGERVCLLDENGDPVPDPNCSGSAWGCCLHQQNRKAVNPWITNNPKPAQPVCPYTAEYVADLHAKWDYGFEQGQAAAEAGNAKSYPSDPSWNEEQTAVVKDGYDKAYDWKNSSGDDGKKECIQGWIDQGFTEEEASLLCDDAGNGSSQPAPTNPYYDGIENQDLKSDWGEEWGGNIGYVNSGLKDAKENKEYNYVSPDWGLPRNLATERAYKTGYYWWKNWYNDGHYLNEANPVGFAPSVSLKGTALVYAPGFEDADILGISVSTYAYFYGKVQENPGWYFTGWSFTEGESDLGGVVAGTAENDSTMFRVLPASASGIANIRNEVVYATFQPVRVSDYKVNGMINGTGNSTTVVFDAVGERVTAEDFTVTCPDANFSASITSCTDNKVTVTVTYSGTANGEFRGNVTLASKSGCSQLTAAVYARVGITSDKEASLYNSKVIAGNLVESDDLTTLIGKASATQIVALNANYNKTLTIDSDVTIFTNGYSINSLNVTAGTVTVLYDKYDGGANTASVTGGKLILNGGVFGLLTVGANGTVEQNGATITGAASNEGSLITKDGVFNNGLTSTGALTIDGGTFEGTTAITISSGTATINKAAISGTTTGILVSGGTTTITSKLVSVYGGTNAVNQTAGSITLQNGKFDGATPLAGTITLDGGYFKTATPGIALPNGKKLLNVLAGTEYAEGYRYFVGDDATGVGVCRIGTTAYTSLENALAYANNNPTKEMVIIMTNDYTLPAGYYTLPAKATLIVPMSNEQETGYEIINRVSNNSAARVEYVQPYEFRRLTFAKGVNLDVHGTIELSGTQRASDDGYAAMPHGAYGHLVMEEGSHMTLQNGSLLRAWGFMTGKGETDARRGAIVREQFQMGDWKGGTESFKMLDVNTNPGRVFPISQYFIQNIEAPVKYHPGAILSTTTSVSAAQGSIGITAMANDIIIVGVGGGAPAMFFMDNEADADNTWVRKWYDAEHDVQTYEVNSGAHIGSMVLDLGKLGTTPLKMNSGMFVLPITNNMKIHLLSGSMDFTQVTSLLPGAEVEVDKESTVTIYSNPDPEVFSGALIIYDADQWGNYAKGKGDTGTKYTKVVKYSPSWDGALVAGKPANGKPNVRHEDDCPDDAFINVHGTFATRDGYLLTTEGGANIFSSNEDAGTFICSQNPPSDETLAGLYVMPINKNEAAKKLYLAKLKNADETYTETAGAIQGLAFIYRDGAWQMPMIQTANDMIVTYNSNCFTADVSMVTYLNLVCNVTDYSSQQAMLASPMKEDVKNQVAIVHAPDNIAEFLAAKPLAAQLAPGEEMTAQGYEWMKHSNEIYQENVTYKQAFAMYKDQIQESANAIKEAGYDFGAAVQKVYIKPQEWLEIAGTAHLQLGIDDVSYYEDLYNEGISEGLSNDNYSKCSKAVNEYLDYIEANKLNPYLEGVEGNADHTYSDAAGAGRLFILTDNCQWWEVEKKDNLYHCIHPNNNTYYEWSDSKEKWVEKTFTITWKDWDGTIIKTTDKYGDLVGEYVVTYGTVAEYLGTNPTRPEDIDYTYDFTGWSPALGRVTSDVTYTATYESKQRKYTVIFLNEGGVEIERQFLTHNEMPVCENTPTKVGHTLEWTPAIAAVTGDATYTATWLEEPPTEYEITFFDYNGTTKLKPTGNEKYMVNVGEMPAPPADPTGKPATDEYTYEFDHWAPAIEKVSANSAKSYTAVYREVDRKYTVIFQDEDGTEIERHDYAVGETPVCSETPTKQATTQYTYKFAWTPQIETVRGAATYKATFTPETNKYTVTLKSNPSGACTLTGAGTYDYNTAITISRTDNPGYTFQNWTDANGEVVNTLPTTVTGDINLVANFKVADPDYTIIWNSEDGNTIYATVGQKSGTATTYTGATPTKPATAQNTFTFYGWSTAANGAGTIYKNGMTPKATANATYYAYFNEKARTYTVTWKNETGTTDIELDYNQPYNASTEYNSATPKKTATAEYTFIFDGWATAPNGNKAYNNGATPKVTGDAVYYAHFLAEPVSVPVVEDNLEIGIDGSEDLEDAVTEKHNLVITSNGNTSGELLGAGNLTLTGEAIFRLEKNMAAETWYAVAVPWTVDVKTGIYAGGKRLAVGDIFVIGFDANVYASANRENGRNDYWKFLDKTGESMQPGKLYMIWLKSAQSAVEFHKTSGDLLTTSTSVVLADGDVEAQKNWNAIANPALYHANLGVSVDDTEQDVLKYNGNDNYVVGSTNNMIVGEPLFVQVASPSTVVAAPATGGAGMPAYRRAPQTATDNRFVVEITRDGQMNDRIIVQTAEEKADEYVIGKDLAKMGVGTKAAQMWMERYNTQLCKNTLEMKGEQAEYPLSLFAPAAGEYVLSAAQERGDATLYLTRNDKPVWNLSYGEYVLNLEKGTTNAYGLRLIAKAPQITTGIGNVQGDDAQCTKVLRDGVIYILRGEKVYTIDGQLVK
ncbi:MAG: hypothetical protein IJP45_00965 [Paludibacteraceae bacterium]|nr:hypothetical protein [Paludibacteraceae bacterium]